MDWQLVLATTLENVLDTLLYRSKIDDVDWCNGDRLPSPEELQMKIILIVRHFFRYITRTF